MVSKIFPTNSIIQYKGQNKNISNDKEQLPLNLKTAVASAFVVGSVLGSTAGILYCLRKNEKLVARKLSKLSNEQKVSNRQSKNIFSGKTTETRKGLTSENVFFSFNYTSDTKPKWYAVKTCVSDEFVTTSSKISSHDKKTDTNKCVIKGIIADISEDIKRYMRVSSIDHKNNVINPERLDEILTAAVGKDNIVERPYVTSVQRRDGKVIRSRNYARGRVKQYKSPNGKVYVLEAHEAQRGIVTRLYMYDKDKHLRAYLFPDGSFRLNSFRLSDAHFRTSNKGIRWMESSPFLNISAKNNP